MPSSGMPSTCDHDVRSLSHYSSETKATKNICQCIAVGGDGRMVLRKSSLAFSWLHFLQVRCDCNRLPILVTSGVISIVGYGKVPLAIPEEKITAVQRVVNSGVPYGPWPS